jgi:hypothetical protein
LLEIEHGEETLEIIFPPNLASISGVLPGGTNVILNFSKAK